MASVRVDNFRSQGSNRKLHPDALEERVYEDWISRDAVLFHIDSLPLGVEPLGSDEVTALLDLINDLPLMLTPSS